MPVISVRRRWSAGYGSGRGPVQSAAVSILYVRCESLFARASLQSSRYVHTPQPLPRFDALMLANEASQCYAFQYHADDSHA